MPFKTDMQTEGPRLSDFIQVEIHPSWCRETVKVAPHAEGLPVGSVLAIDSTGSCVPYMTDLGDAAHADKASCVLIQTLTASDAAQDGVVLARGCVLTKSFLHFDDAVTDPEQQNALAALNALGIVCKE